MGRFTWMAASPRSRGSTTGPTGCRCGCGRPRISWPRSAPKPPGSTGRWVTWSLPAAGGRVRSATGGPLTLPPLNFSCGKRSESPTRPSWGTARTRDSLATTFRIAGGQFLDFGKFEGQHCLVICRAAQWNRTRIQRVCAGGALRGGDHPDQRWRRPDHAQPHLEGPKGSGQVRPRRWPTSGPGRGGYTAGRRCAGAPAGPGSCRRRSTMSAWGPARFTRATGARDRRTARGILLPGPAPAATADNFHHEHQLRPPAAPAAHAGHPRGGHRRAATPGARAPSQRRESLLVAMTLLLAGVTASRLDDPPGHHPSQIFVTAAAALTVILPAGNLRRPAGNQPPAVAGAPGPAGSPGPAELSPPAMGVNRAVPADNGKERPTAPPCQENPVSRRPGLPEAILAEVADRAMYGAGHDDTLPTDLTERHRVRDPGVRRTTVIPHARPGRARSSST